MYIYQINQYMEALLSFSDSICISVYLLFFTTEAHVHIRIYMCLCIYTCLYRCILYTYTYHIHIYIYILMRVHMHTSMCVYIAAPDTGRAALLSGQAALGGELFTTYERLKLYGARP